MSALNGVRIVELAESVAGEYCGKLLADFGAEVIKVERPGTRQPTRAMAPIVDDGCEQRLFAYLNTNKKSVVLDVARDADACTTLDRRRARGHRRPRVVGRAGEPPSRMWCSARSRRSATMRPPRCENAKSINVFHASGWGYHTPSHADPAHAAAEGPGRFLADYEAGLDAALCVASSLFAQLHTGEGEFIDVSAHAVLVSRADCILGRFITGEIAPEGSPRRLRPAGAGVVFRRAATGTSICT